MNATTARVTGTKPIGAMLKDKHFMAIPPKWVNRAERFAGTMGKRNRRGDYAVDSRAKKGNMDRTSKISEVGTAFFCRLDPDTAVDWSTRQQDPGWDIVTVNGTKIDVKASDHPRSRNLIWPAYMTKLYDGKDFDYLAFVRVEDMTDDWAACEFMGCVTKDRFKEESVKEGHKFTAGTWAMDRDNLDDMIILRNPNG